MDLNNARQGSYFCICNVVAFKDICYFATMLHIDLAMMNYFENKNNRS